jgi:GT2 family glycosyltransferase
MSKASPSVAVIVLNYNGMAYVKRCLGALLRNSYSNFEVLFIDNNSTDGSAEAALRLFHSEPRFKLIRNRENFGFSVGNNIGFKRANTKYVIVLNNDAEVEKTFIETLVRIAESDGKIGSVSCRIVQLDRRILYGPMYMSYGFIVHALSKQTYDRYTVSLANCGCATLFRKSVIDRIGGFDPYFWADWEDHDLGYRMNIAGFKCVYAPETTVLHLGGGIYLGMSEEREIRIFRNKLLTYAKNYQTKNLFLRFPLILMIELLLKLKRGKGRYFLKGISQFFKLLKPIINERKQIQKSRVVSEDSIFLSCRIPEQMSFWKSLKL